MKSSFGLVMLFLILGLLGGAMTANCQDGPPSYAIQYLGTGSVVAVNNNNTVAGFRTHSTTGAQTPLVSMGGGAWMPLPVPEGASSAFPTDINDGDVIVGVASMTSGRRAIRWIPTDSGYAVEVLPLLPGELASFATGINNLGQVVGARAGIVGTPFGFGWLYTDAGGLVDLNTRYGWFATPDDINDAGVILAGTQLFDLATETLTDVGLSGPSNYNAIGGVDINNSGQIVGSASLRSISLNIISVFRYLPGTGWEFISGTSKYTLANDINNRGDVCWGEQGAGIYFDGLGGYALGSLLDPAAAEAGWVITGNGCMVNEHRVVATVGRNNLSGQSGAVLLTPVGLLQPPAAPTGLTATPHPATFSEPYMSINLSWNNSDALLTRTYELERRVSGQVTWTSVELVPPAMSTFHQDTTVAPATTYDYRVRAVGVAGPGPWSATTTVNNDGSALLYATFAGAGVHMSNGTSWTQLTPYSPSAIVAAGSLLYGDFGSNGIWMYNGTAWSQLTQGNPEAMAAAGSLLYGDFGSNGIWMYNGTTWSQLTQGNPEAMAAAGSLLYGDFGSSGIWMYNGTTWSQTTPSNPQMMTVSGSSLYGAFPGAGIWKWNGSTWSQTTPSNPEAILASGSLLYGDFGSSGIWMYNGTAWSQTTPSNPQMMTVSGSSLYGAFPGAGIWKWDGSTWSQVTPNDPVSMVTGY